MSGRYTHLTMAGLEAFIVGCILVTSVLLMLSFAVLIKKGDYGQAIRFGGAMVMAIVSAELGRSGPEPSGVLAKLSIIPLVISIYLTVPVVRRAWDLLRGRSSVS